MRKSGGVSILEVVTVLAVVAIFVGLTLPYAVRALNDQRIDRTTTLLDHLRRGITGSPVIIINEARTSFGYLGDMGNLPAQLEDLWIQGSQPSFAFNSTLKTGAGWKGPYLDPGIVSFIESLQRDEWSRLLSYTSSAATNSTVGMDTLGQIASSGPDGVLSSGDDLTVDFFKTEIVSRVFGFVRNPEVRGAKGEPVPGVRLTMNYPSSGALTTKSTTTDAVGFYLFEDIPYGNRSITIEPKIVLAPDTAFVTGPDDNDLEFVIKNFAATDLTLTSMKQSNGSDPPIFFTTLRIDGQMKYSSTSNRIGDDELVDFSASPVTLAGTGKNAESLPIRIQSPTTEIPDIVIGQVGRGGQAKVRLEDFRLADSGTQALKANIVGLTFTVTWSDGSVLQFVPVDQ